MKRFMVVIDDGYETLYFGISARSCKQARKFVRKKYGPFDYKIKKVKEFKNGYIK